MSRTHAFSFLMLATLATVGRADIAIDFVGGSAPGNDGLLGGGAVQTMKPDEIAGVSRQANWNTAGSANLADRIGNNTGTITGTLVDDQGKTLSDASITWKGNNNSSTIIADKPGNERMMRGYLDSADPNNILRSSTSTVTITVPNNYAEAGYDVIVYFDCNSSAGETDRVARYRLFAGKVNTGAPLAQIFGKSVRNVDFYGGFVQARGTTAKDASAGNYVVFHALKLNTITLDATGVAGDVMRAPISAIQIVSGHAIPPAGPKASETTDAVVQSNSYVVPAHSGSFIMPDPSGASVMVLPGTPLVPAPTREQSPLTTLNSNQVRPQMIKVTVRTPVAPGGTLPLPAPNVRPTTLTQ